jgi:serine/threonine-protein kinase
VDESASRLGAGVILDGSYELLSVIGSGGMGTVWRAQHRRLPKQVAVKVLKGAAQADSEVLARFRREAEIASRLENPHIVEALDFNTLGDGTPYMVLELLSGESLRARLQRGPLPIAEAVEVVRQVGSALTAAHAQGVIHRDLKPENIFLTTFDERLLVKVLDFGLSRITGADTALTKDGAVFGTPLYMAPEQAQGAPADARSDQHALAMVLFEMIHGRPAFVAEQPLQVLFRIVHETAPTLGALCPGVPPALSDAVERALSKEAGDRFPSVRGFIQAVEAGGTSDRPPTRETEPVGSEPTVLESARRVGAGHAGAISGHEETLSPAQARAPLPKTLPPLETHRSPLPRTLPPLDPPPAAPGTERAGAPIAASGARRLSPGLAALLGALAVAAVGGGLWLTLRATPSPPKVTAVQEGAAGTTPRRPDAARPAIADPSGATRPAAELGAAKSAPPPDLAASRPRVDARRVTRPAPVAAPPLAPALAERIQRAEALLAAGDFVRAGVEAERLERDLPAGHKWRGAFVRVRAHCAARQRPDAEGAYRRVIPRAERAAALRYCRRFFPDFNPDVEP